MCRSEKYLIAAVTVVLATLAIMNTVLNERGHFITVYMRTRDVAVVSIAGALLIGNFALMRKNRSQGLWFLALLCLLAMVATVHIYRLVYGGLPCR